MGGPKAKAKRKRCGRVNLDLLADFFQDIWDKKSCILKEVGWVDEDGEFQPDNIMADINTLDPRLSSGLNDTEELCTSRAEDMTVQTMFQSDIFGEAEMEAPEESVAAQAEK